MTEKQTQTEEQSKTYTEDEVRERIERKLSQPLDQIRMLKERLAEMESEGAAAKAEREKQEAERLAKNQEFEKLYKTEAEKAAELKAKHDSTVAEYESRILNMQLDTELARAGVSNEFTILGIKAKYSALDDPPPVAEFMTALREETPEAFGAPVDDDKQVGTKNAAAGTVRRGANLSDAQLKESLKSSDPEVRKQAHDHVLNKYGLNNKRF